MRQGKVQMRRFSEFLPAMLVLAVMVENGWGGTALPATQPSTRTPASTGQGRLALEKDSTLVWGAKAGRSVRVNEPQLTLENPKDNTRLPFKVELKNRSVRNGQAVMEYMLSLNERGFNIAGTATIKSSLLPDPQEDVLIGHMELAFREAVTANVETVCAFDVQGEPAGQIGLPERNGYFRVRPLLPDVGGAGRFELGCSAKGPVQCPAIGMPVIGLILGDQGANEPRSAGGAQGALQLAVAADPYCGSYIHAKAVAET